MEDRCLLAENTYPQNTSPLLPAATAGLLCTHTDTHSHTHTPVTPRVIDNGWIKMFKNQIMWYYVRKKKPQRCSCSYSFLCELHPNRKCVKEWEEPHDCTLYCIQTDGNHMIASGSSHYGVVRLWDKRQSKCLQVCTVFPREERNDIFFRIRVESVASWACLVVKQQAECCHCVISSCALSCSSSNCAHIQ